MPPSVLCANAAPYVRSRPKKLACSGPRPSGQLSTGTDGRRVDNEEAAVSRTLGVSKGFRVGRLQPGSATPPQAISPCGDSSAKYTHLVAQRPVLPCGEPGRLARRHAHREERAQALWQRRPKGLLLRSQPDPSRATSYGAGNRRYFCTYQRSSGRSSTSSPSLWTW